MSTKILIDTVPFLRMSRGLNDIELGATMRALIESALDDGRPKNVMEASFFGTRTNGFVHLDRESSISVDTCGFAEAIQEA